MVEAKASEEARLRAALMKYRDDYCEGWCREGDGIFDDCGGCPAKDALSISPAPDHSEVSPTVQKSMDYFHRRCAEVDAEAMRTKTLEECEAIARKEEAHSVALNSIFNGGWMAAAKHIRSQIAALKGNGEGK
jgi:hypothetical protein